MRWLQKARDTPSAVLLFVQLAAVLLYPFMENSRPGRISFSILGIAVLWLAVLAVGRTPSFTWISIILAIPAMLLLLAQSVFDETWMGTWSAGFEAVLYFYVAIGLIRYMFADHVVTTDELFAVGATFTLVAWGFAYVFLVVQAVDPHSFTAAVAADEPRSWMELLFLSFTTLSSTGLSDVVPIKAFARSVVMIEQLAGVLYIAMVITRMVGLSFARSGAPPAEATRRGYEGMTTRLSVLGSDPLRLSNLSFADHQSTYPPLRREGANRAVRADTRAGCERSSDRAPMGRARAGVPRAPRPRRLCRPRCLRAGDQRRPPRSQQHRGPSRRHRHQDPDRGVRPCTASPGWASGRRTRRPRQRVHDRPGTADRGLHLVRVGCLLRTSRQVRLVQPGSREPACGRPGAYRVADRARRRRADPETGDGHSVVDVKLVDLPVNLIAHYQSKFFDLRREMTLIDLSSSRTDTVAHRLTELSVRMEATARGRRHWSPQVCEPSRAGLDRVTVVLPVATSMLPEIREFQQLLVRGRRVLPTRAAAHACRRRAGAGAAILVSR